MCGRAAEAQRPHKFKVIMDDICLPVRFEGITEEGVKAHLRYCASSLKSGDRVEFLLCDVGVVIPVVKSVYRKKSSTLDILIRSGSMGRDQLEELRTSLSVGGYDLRVSFTTRKKLLKTRCRSSQQRTRSSGNWLCAWFGEPSFTRTVSVSRYLQKRGLPSRVRSGQAVAQNHFVRRVSNKRWHGLARDRASLVSDIFNARGT